MKLTSILLGAALMAGCLFLNCPAMAEPLGTAVTYVGQVNEAGAPANGSFDIRYVLYTSDVGGSQVGSILTELAVPVVNGRFVNTLDFGPTAFNGEVRWLEIAVRRAGTGDYEVLSPRRKLGSVPNAVFAVQAGTAANATTAAPNAVNTAAIQPGSVTADKVPDGHLVRSVNEITDHVVLAQGEDMKIVRDGANLIFSSTNHWKLGGNAGTTPGLDFLGTTDDRELQFRVNGQLAMRIKPNGSSTPSIIAGAQGNGAGSAMGATISGGGADLYMGQQEVNRVYADFGTVGGGSRNTIDTQAGWATIAGGYRNTVENQAEGGAIGGGVTNVIQQEAGYATIGGGFANLIQTNAERATIGGGGDNVIETNAVNSTIGGGKGNVIQASANNSTISGGDHNLISGFSDGWSGTHPAGLANTIGGGSENRIEGKSGSYHTVAGGRQNWIRVLPATTGATISGGFGNSIGGFNSNGDGFGSLAWQSTISGGNRNTNNFAWGSIGGGASNLVQASYATIPGGCGAVARIVGQLAYANRHFSSAGDAQSSLYVLKTSTTDATVTELTPSLKMPEASTWAFEILVVARSIGVNSAGYRLQGLIRNDSGTPVFIGTPQKTVLGEDNSAWDVTVEADNASDALAIRVTGSNGVEIRWVATVRTTEVIF